jgi:hypothetical protein
MTVSGFERLVYLRQPPPVASHYEFGAHPGYLSLLLIQSGRRE